MAVLLLAFSSILVYFFDTFIRAIPRSGVPFFATMFATLLGLTFTAFAILAAFLPNIERDFLGTKTFSVFQITFELTLSLELVSLILSIIAYLSFSTEIYLYILYSLVFSTMLTIGFLGLLINKTFYVFTITKEGLLK